MIKNFSDLNLNPEFRTIADIADSEDTIHILFNEDLCHIQTDSAPPAGLFGGDIGEPRSLIILLLYLLRGRQQMDSRYRLKLDQLQSTEMECSCPDQSK